MTPRIGLSPTEDAIAQKRTGAPDYVGAYNVGKYDGGGAVSGLTLEPRQLRHLDKPAKHFTQEDDPYLDIWHRL